MKLVYGGTPVNSMKVKHYELNTNGATCEPSAVQAGLTYFANGKKEVGTGRSFEFADYGEIRTNLQIHAPTLINVVEIASLEYPIKSLIPLTQMKDTDFSTEQTIGVVVIDDIEYPISIKIEGYILIFNCEKTVMLNFFYGKDNYI